MKVSPSDLMGPEPSSGPEDWRAGWVAEFVQAAGSDMPTSVVDDDGEA